MAEMKKIKKKKEKILLIHAFMKSLYAPYDTHTHTHTHTHTQHVDMKPHNVSEAIIAPKHLFFPLSSKLGIDRLCWKRRGEEAAVVLITGKGEENTVIIKRGRKEKGGK